ncbi:MAG: molybdopterin-binding protein, partial [Oscillospiraceae bacterium]
QTVVGDNRARLEQAVQLARTRADLIITTGGLGPTCDDLTKEVVAGAFGARAQRGGGGTPARPVPRAPHLHDREPPAAGHAAARLHRAAKRLGHGACLCV